MPPTQQLKDLLAQSTPAAFSRELLALRDALLQQYDGAVDAMLFYGSCLRSGDALNGLVDLYLVVDDYRNAYGKPLPALFNRNRGGQHKTDFDPHFIQPARKPVASGAQPAGDVRRKFPA